MNQASEIERTPTGASTRLSPLLPGVALCAAIAAFSVGLRNLSGWAALSPMILSIIVGILIQNLVGSPAQVLPGIAFAMKRILRLGIILLGLQITLEQIVKLGASALAVIALTLVATFVAIRYAGRLMGVDRALTDLIAAGTAVCGASAVIAANTVAAGKDEDVAYAVASVTILGSASMLIYPLLAVPLGLDDFGYGLWTGATVHEVAQVTAASFQHSDAAGQSGTVAKLTRVVMLAPLVFAMALLKGRVQGESTKARTPMPWFVLGFVALVLANSALDLPQTFHVSVALVATFLLSMALAAMGLQTDIGKLRARGLRPLLLGVFGWVFIATFGFSMVTLWGY